MDTYKTLTSMIRNILDSDVDTAYRNAELFLDYLDVGGLTPDLSRLNPTQQRVLARLAAAAVLQGINLKEGR